MAINYEKERIFQDKIRSGYYIILEDGTIYNKYGKKLGSSCKKGYVFVGIRHEGRTFMMLLHRLVWFYFYGEIPSDRMVCHKDRNRNNNELKNLELLTQSELNKKLSIGAKRPVGVKRSNSRLTEDDVVFIRRNIRTFSEVKIFAKQHAMAPQTVYSALLGQTWRHVNEAPLTKTEAGDITKEYSPRMKTKAKIHHSPKPIVASKVTTKNARQYVTEFLQRKMSNKIDKHTRN